MDMAALIAWIVTALGGSYLLATWLICGGLRQRNTGVTRFPASLIFGHFLLAASGLGSWTAYVLTDRQWLAWAASIGLLLIAALGFTMFFRWGGETEHAVAAVRPSTPGAATDPTTGRDTARGAGPGRGAAPGMKGGAAITKPRIAAERPAESHFPSGVVAVHGAFAVSTIIIVVLATLGVGG